MLPPQYRTNLINLGSNPSTCPPKPWQRRKLRPSEARFGAKKGRLHTLQTIPSLPFSGLPPLTSATHSGSIATIQISSFSDFGPGQNTTPSAELPSLQKPVSSIAVASMSFVLPLVAIGNSGKIPTCPTNMPATTSLLLSTLWNRETKY